jgi:hypothetical protein
MRLAACDHLLLDHAFADLAGRNETVPKAGAINSGSDAAPRRCHAVAIRVVRHARQQEARGATLALILAGYIHHFATPPEIAASTATRFVFGFAGGAFISSPTKSG